MWKARSPPTRTCSTASTSTRAGSPTRQWRRHSARLASGQRIDAELIRRLVDEELAKIRGLVGDQAYEAGRFKEARDVFDQLVLPDDFAEFLTLPAYGLID